MEVDRDGKHCQMCGSEVFNWQKNEFNVVGTLCPECTLSMEDMGYDEDEMEEMAAML